MSRLPDYLVEVFAQDDIARREFEEYQWRSKKRQQEERNPVEHAHINEQLIEVLENAVATDEYLLGRIMELDAELKMLHRLLRDFRLPPLEAWVPDKFYPAGSITLAGGSCFQARTATMAAPGSDDWQVIVSAGEDGRDGRDANDDRSRSTVIDLPSGFRLVDRGKRNVA